jgi:hypothetical protein
MDFSLTNVTHMKYLFLQRVVYLTSFGSLRLMHAPPLWSNPECMLSLIASYSSVWSTFTPTPTPMMHLSDFCEDEANQTLCTMVCSMVDVLDPSHDPDTV